MHYLDDMKMIARSNKYEITLDGIEASAVIALIESCVSTKILEPDMSTFKPLMAVKRKLNKRSLKKAV